MTVPSRNQQIEAVVKFLDSERNQERSLKEIATEIVDGYREMLLGGIKKPATPLREGMLLKSPYDAKVRRVAWLDDQRGEVWVIHETSSYGWLGPVTSPAWESCEEFRPSVASRWTAAFRRSLTRLAAALLHARRARWSR